MSTPGVDAADTADRSPAGSAMGFERVVVFSDAVFAIVITLLVLPLTAEFELPGQGERVDLLHEVVSRWPQVLTFVVTFLVIGQFWLAHHRMFDHLARADTGLLWANLAFLLTICFLPFPSALLGAQKSYDDRFPTVFYALSMTVASAAITAMWGYAVRRGLLGPHEQPQQVRSFTIRSLATTATFAVSVGAALAGLLYAALIWTVLLPAVRLALARTAARPAR